MIRFLEPRALARFGVLMAADDRPGGGNAEASVPWTDRELLSILSHDLQNQLSIILILAQRLRDASTDLGEIADTVDRIEIAIRDASALALNVRRAEELARDDTENATLASFAEIVSSIVRQEMPRVRAKRIDLIVEVDAALPAVAVDDALLRRALANLLGQALRSAPQASRLRLTARPTGAGVEMMIDHPASSSDPLDTASLARRPADASSVAWFVTRKVLEAHGCSLRLSAAGEGRATVRVFVPAAAIENAPPHSR